MPQLTYLVCKSFGLIPPGSQERTLQNKKNYRWHLKVSGVNWAPMFQDPEYASLLLAIFTFFFFCCFFLADEMIKPAIYCSFITEVQQQRKNKTLCVGFLMILRSRCVFYFAVVSMPTKLQVLPIYFQDSSVASFSSLSVAFGIY